VAARPERYVSPHELVECLVSPQRPTAFRHTFFLLYRSVLAPRDVLTRLLSFLHSPPARFGGEEGAAEQCKVKTVAALVAWVRDFDGDFDAEMTAQLERFVRTANRQDAALKPLFRTLDCSSASGRPRIVEAPLQPSSRALSGELRSPQARSPSATDSPLVLRHPRGAAPAAAPASPLSLSFCARLPRADSLSSVGSAAASPRVLGSLLAQNAFDLSSSPNGTPRLVAAAGGGAPALERAASATRGPVLPSEAAVPPSSSSSSSSAVPAAAAAGNSPAVAPAAAPGEDEAPAASPPSAPASQRAARTHTLRPRIPAETYARCLAAMDAPLLRAASELEFVDMAWRRDPPSAPHVVALMDRFNQLALWLAGEILRAPSPDARADALRHVAAIGAHSLALNNFHAAFAADAALTSHPVFRLKGLHGALDSRARRGLEQLRALTSASDNFAAYRAAVARCLEAGEAHLPYLGVALKDLVALSERSVAELKQGVVDLERWQRVGDVIERVAKQQQLLENWPPPAAAGAGGGGGGGGGEEGVDEAQLTRKLARAVAQPRSEEELLRLSLALEPKMSWHEHRVRMATSVLLEEGFL
jgi:hypothetical protein